MSRLRLVTIGLIALLVVLQYPLWFGNGGLLTVWGLKREIAAQREDNARLRERNQALGAEVIDLKQGLDAVEERARVELGMIKKGETFFQVIDEAKGMTPTPEARSRGVR
jgi:cell division protein FtsB